MKAKEDKVFRVFLARHYIAVDWVDVVAKTPGKAKQRARQVINKMQPDPRAGATDNGWIPDDPVEVSEPGHREGGTHPMEEVAPGVFRFKN